MPTRQSLLMSVLLSSHLWTGVSTNICLPDTSYKWDLCCVLPQNLAAAVPSPNMLFPPPTLTHPLGIHFTSASLGSFASTSRRSSPPQALRPQKTPRGALSIFHNFNYSVWLLCSYFP